MACHTRATRARSCASIDQSDYSVVAVQGVMSEQDCLAPSRSSATGPPTLEELLQGNSERGKLYHAVLKKLRETAALRSGKLRTHPLPLSASTPTQSQGWRSQPYFKPVTKTPQQTPFFAPHPSPRHNHPYSRAASSAAVRPYVGPYATVSSPAVQPARPVPPVLQNRVDAMQCGSCHPSAAVATPPPPRDGTTPMDTPTGASATPCIVSDGMLVACPVITLTPGSMHTNCMPICMALFAVLIVAM